MMNNQHDLSRPKEPLPPRDIQQLYKLSGPHEDTPDHAALEHKMGFRYRILLGELLYAYIIGRLDIGYVITTLANFFTHPAPFHYTKLCNVAKYLRCTIDWGLVYWRENPNPTLPDSPHLIPSYDPSDALPAFPCASLHELIGYVDAAYVNDLHRRHCTTGYAFLLAGAAIPYRCKTQSLTATSSTEVEFLAAVTAGKITKYLRSILTELGYPPLGPTILYEDNASAIKMINAGKPTEQSCHIDIQHLTIQDWRQ
jgi:hypothetical protein